MISRKIIQSYVFLLLIFITSLYIYLGVGIYSDFKVLITNLIIILISLIFMSYGDKYNYSLNKIFMLFAFFFFGIAPALQYKYGVVMWGGTSFTNQEYIKINILIIGILIIYQVFYSFFSKMKIKSLVLKKERNTLKSVSTSSTLLLIISVVSMLITIYFNNFSLENLILRSGGAGEKLEIGSSVYLVYSNFIRPMPVVALIIFKLFSKENKKIENILLLIVLITNFPTARARFYIAAIYIPILLVYFKQVNKKYMLLNKLIIIGLLILFPFLDQMRRIKSFTELKYSFDFKMFLQGHFDSYQMFLRVVESEVITKGSQLLTAIFFFIPRSLWEEKSVGSGFFVSEKVGLSFNNVSMNFFGEGYINFGYFGILIFVIIIAFINARLDKNFWESAKKETIDMFSVFYMFMLGLEIFILRGDLLSSFAFTIGILFSVIFVYNLTIKR